jgi:Outer membrane protein beta-barrel domain
LIRLRAQLLTLAVVLAAGLTSASSIATAQTQPPAKPQPPTPTTRQGARPSSEPGPSRGFVTFGVGAQIGSNDFSETHSEPLNAEQKTFTANYAVKTGLEFEIGGGWRIWHNLFAGATYSRFHDSRAADITAQIPHPFFFNQPRSISGSSSDLAHDENAAHISLWWIVPAGRRFEVGIFGGPSIIGVSQGLVTDVQYAETYPYDTATFSQAIVADASKTAFGVHGGLDVTWLLNKQIGVGGSVRYSHASVDLSTPSGGSVSFDAGGLQAAVTVKVRILAKEPARVPARPAPPRTAPGTAPRPPVGTIATAVTTATAPVFLRPDATLTPLRQLPTGTHLRVLDQTAEWLHVEFEDRQYGRRVGYVQKAFARVETGR